MTVHPFGNEEGDPVVTERRGPLLVLTLNRPHRLNAVSLSMYRRLIQEVEGVGKDRDLRAIVVTGSGRGFSVGADLKAHGEGEPDRDFRRSYVAAAHEANLAVQEAPVPVVAAVNGHAVGAGLELALSADLMVVAREAKLRLPELALGTFVGGGVTQTLAARVGGARARRILLLAPFLSGAEAAGIGLADEAVPAEEVLTRALALAEEVAAMAPVSVRLARELLRKAPHLDRHQVMEAEAEALLRCMETRDWREGIRAFEEKRPPSFQGT
jgi:enoyl-CoA hydratase